MRRPVDPRKHGLKDPVKFITKTISRDLETSQVKPYYNSVFLSEINAVWNSMKDALSSTDQTVVTPPYIVSSGLNRALSIECKVQYENTEYNNELKFYQGTVKTYEEELVKFAAYEERKKLKLAEDLDEQILRLEKRLANCKATRDGLPLPYPPDNKN